MGGISVHIARQTSSRCRWTFPVRPFTSNIRGAGFCGSPATEALPQTMTRSGGTGVLPASELSGKFGREAIGEEAVGFIAGDVSLRLESMLGEPVAGKLLDEPSSVATTARR